MIRIKSSKSVKMTKPKYPGLKKDEIEVMDRFLAGPHPHGEITYDVKLYLKEHLIQGGINILPLGTSLNEQYKRILAAMNRLSKITYGGSDIQASRIDCVIETDDTIWILEVTPKLKKHVIGGCELYPDLFAYQFGLKPYKTRHNDGTVSTQYKTDSDPPKTLKTGIVAGRDDPRSHHTLLRLHTRLWIV